MSSRALFETAAAASARGELPLAKEKLLVALGREDLAASERIHGLLALSSVYRRAGEWMNAERAAGEALERAIQLGHPDSLARAHLELGTLMLLVFEEDATIEESDPLSSAMAHLDEAGRLYESSRSIDFYPCLLALARALEAADEDSRGIYARITRDLVADEWVVAAAESAEVARHIDYLRGRAFYGLGCGELALGNTAVADDRLSAASELLGSTQAADAPALIEHIAALRLDLQSET